MFSRKFFSFTTLAVALLLSILFNKVGFVFAQNAHWAGETHNAGVEYVLTELTADDLRNSSQRASAISTLVEKYINLYGVPNVVTRPLTEQGQRFVDHLFVLITEEPSLHEFERKLTSLEEEVRQTLDNEEATFILDAISVARYSGALWTPASKGGMSGWRYLAPKKVSDEAAAKINWGDVVKADVKGFLNDGIPGAVAESVSNLLHQLLD